jgi:hypothetical protein
MIDVQLLRGTASQVAAYTGPKGELVVDTTNWLLYLQDGVTAGGHLVGGIASFPVSVAQGGTGDTSLTAHAVLLGEGTSAVAFATIGTANRVLADNGSGADPSFKTLTALLDAVFGSAQGDVLYRGASLWAALAPGTSGNFLQTQGASANPQWAAVTGLSAIADGDLLANTSGGSAVPVATTLSALLDYVFGSAQGDLLYRGASAWAALAPGTSGQFLKTQGSSANPQWATVGAGAGGGFTLDAVTTGTSHTVTLSANQTITYWSSATAGAKTTNIPGAGSGNSGYLLIVKTTLGNGDTHTITPASGTVDGNSSLSFTDNKDAIGLISDGSSNWMIAP